MENTFEVPTLSTLAKGALEELFQRAHQELLANIQDVNTPADAKRSITIKLVYEADESRQLVDLAFAVSPSLASARGAKTVLHTSDRKKDGKFQAFEGRLTQSVFPMAVVPKITPAPTPEKGVE